MRVLHVVKTSDGALWAASQSAVLTRLGVEVHVALPRLKGRAVSAWRSAGAVIHEADLSLPLAKPSVLRATVRRARRLVSEVRPDLIHSHFVTTTLLLRWALGKEHPIPRIFQVAGPLHLEHRFYRRSEISLAGPRDFWIASSRCIANHYLGAGVPRRKVFLSYYGLDTRNEEAGCVGVLRRRVGASDNIVVGNISFMYPPKWYLGHVVGLKCHETLIDALGIVTRKNPTVLGVLAGGAWGNAFWYEERLRRRAKQVGDGRIRLPGPLSPDESRVAWRDFDLAVHVPLSENCGGVVEPLLAGRPVVASNVGGIPEVVVPGQTGWLVPPRCAETLARVILTVLGRREEASVLAERGRQLVKRMFDVERTGREVLEIYQHILDRNKPSPPEFNSLAFLERLSS